MIYNVDIAGFKFEKGTFVPKELTDEEKKALEESQKGSII